MKLIFPPELGIIPSHGFCNYGSFIKSKTARFTYEAKWKPRTYVNVLQRWQLLRCADRELKSTHFKDAKVEKYWLMLMASQNNKTHKLINWLVSSRGLQESIQKKIRLQQILLKKLQRLVQAVVVVKNHWRAPKINSRDPPTPFVHCNFRLGSGFQDWEWKQDMLEIFQHNEMHINCVTEL